MSRVGLAFVALLMLASLARAQVLVKVDGSSTMFPLTEAVARQYQIRNRGTVRVTVGISGTTGGFRKFCRGETDIHDASRPILEPEMQSCRSSGIQYFEIPVAFDALTVAVSPRNTWVESMTLEQLKRLWEPAAQGTIVRWKQLDPTWPDEPITLFGADVDSGTFDYFTQAVTGEVRASRNDYLGSGDDNVLVRGIEGNRHALGYVPYAYYAAHAGRVKALAIDAGGGPVSPDAGTVLDGSYTPLSRPLFIYVSAQAAQRAEVRGFVEFFLVHGRPLIERTRYVALDEVTYTAALRNFRDGKLGTAFDGRPEVGLRIEDVLERESRL